MIEVISIVGLGAIALYFNYKTDLLKEENKGLRDRIKRNQEWFDLDKKMSVELAIVNERFKISSEQFQKQCDKLGK